MGYNHAGKIERSYSKGAVSGTENTVGGLVGINYWPEALITKCYATGAVSGLRIVGGLVGDNFSNSMVKDSYATGAVSSTDDFCETGGLVGMSSGRIINSYSTGRVSVTASVSFCTNGGLVGDYGDGDRIEPEYDIMIFITNSYWDIETSGMTVGVENGNGRDITSMVPGLTGLTTNEMYEQSSFVNWDFTTIWHAPSASEQKYPLLRGVDGQ